MGDVFGRGIPQIRHFFLHGDGTKHHTDEDFHIHWIHCVFCHHITHWHHNWVHNLFKHVNEHTARCYGSGNVNTLIVVFSFEFPGIKSNNCA